MIVGIEVGGNTNLPIGPTHEDPFNKAIVILDTKINAWGNGEIKYETIANLD